MSETFPNRDKLHSQGDGGKGRCENPAESPPQTFANTWDAFHDIGSQVTATRIQRSETAQFTDDYSIQRGACRHGVIGRYSMEAVAAAQHGAFCGVLFRSV